VEPGQGALTCALDGDELDASLLLLAELGLVAATDLRFVSICNAIGHELCRNGRIMRYTNDDGFGAPETAFLVGNFCYNDGTRGDWSTK
jgi:GH15 family glucan-1,4-alpha-glucosidase